MTIIENAPAAENAQATENPPAPGSAELSSESMDAAAAPVAKRGSRRTIGIVVGSVVLAAGLFGGGIATGAAIGGSSATGQGQFTGPGGTGGQPPSGGGPGSTGTTGTTGS